MKLIKSSEFEGYYLDDIKEELGIEKYKKFLKWFVGQTGAIHEEKFLVYKWDWERYQKGSGPFD